MCIYVHCTYMHINTYMHVLYVYARICRYITKQLQVYMHIHTYTYIRAYMHISVYVEIRTYMHI
jgi:hypothetical protein